MLSPTLWTPRLALRRNRYYVRDAPMEPNTYLCAATWALRENTSPVPKTQTHCKTHPKPQPKPHTHQLALNYTRSPKVGNPIASILKSHV